MVLSVTGRFSGWLSLWFCSVKWLIVFSSWLSDRLVDPVMGCVSGWLCMCLALLVVGLLSFSCVSCCLNQWFVEYG